MGFHAVRSPDSEKWPFRHLPICGLSCECGRISRFSSQMKTVITIHGINTLGPWQEDIGRILECHFRHVPIKHKKYRRLGALKLVSDPWVILIGGFLWWVAAHLGFGVNILGAAGALVACGFAGALLRRRSLFAEVKKQLDPHMMHGGVPHLIAHSFGTYLAGRTLNFVETEFDVMILTGSVLPQRFWSTLKSKTGLASEDRRYNRVRNERCLKDRVSQAAFLLYGLVPGMGHSGYAGFTRESGLVHDLDNAWTVCPKCATKIAPVHNVPHRELGHSDLFIGRLHAVRIWLPVIWGFEPKEYDQFIKLCRLAASFHAETDYQRLAEIEFLLAKRTWSLTGGVTIPQFLKRHIIARCQRLGKPLPAHLEDLSVLGTALVWQVVEDAASAALEAERPTCHLIKALLPVTALIRAAEAVC